MPYTNAVGSSYDSGEYEINMDRATFDKMHAADRMASDKLAEGISGFSKALENLEAMLAKRITELEPELVSA